MRSIYFDCFAGISGDMLVGALVDLGLDKGELENELQKLPVEGYQIKVSRVEKRGISSIRFQVFLEGETGTQFADSEFHETEAVLSEIEYSNIHQPRIAARSLNDILELIDRSGFSEKVRSNISAIFTRLGQAEAKVHGVPLEQVHFHEVGGLDAIVDITSAVIGFDKLGIEAVFASPLHLGGGFVRSNHGVLPVPAPATSELLKGAAVYTTDVKGELVTPTGAAILGFLSRGYGPLPEMELLAIGYGAGSRDREFPNVLRAYLGEVKDETGKQWVRGPRSPYPQQHEAPVGPQGYHEGPAVVLEANIDDSNPQIFEHLIERILDAGALDVALVPVYMKKSRPAVQLQVLSHPETVEELIRIIFLESTTIGLRSYPVKKHMLARQIETIDTEFGPVGIKIAQLGGQVVNVKPEYEDCRDLAIRLGIPVKDVYQAALSAVYRERYRYGDRFSEH